MLNARLSSALHALPIQDPNNAHVQVQMVVAIAQRRRDIWLNGTGGCLRVTVCAIVRFECRIFGREIKCEIQFTRFVVHFRSHHAPRLQRVWMDWMHFVITRTQNNNISFSRSLAASSWSRDGEGERVRCCSVCQWWWWHAEWQLETRSLQVASARSAHSARTGENIEMLSIGESAMRSTGDTCNTAIRPIINSSHSIFNFFNSCSIWEC